MNKTKIGAILVAVALSCGSAGSALAQGTPSGTVITNQATATYNDGTGQVTKTANAPNVVVDNKVNLTVTKIGDLTVLPGTTNQGLVFTVTNNGNTSQRYALTATNSAGSAMNNVRIYLDNGTTANAWDAGDTLYVNAATFGDIAPDATIKILIVADVPAGAANGDTSDYQLIATTVDAGTTKVTTETSGANTDGVDVVFADIAGSAAGDNARDGKHSAAATYTVNVLALNLVKTVAVVWDPMNLSVNPKAIPGATLTYTVTATVTGVGTAAGVVITDPIPTNATYIPNTLKLNGSTLTDTTDGDAGSVGGTPETVTVGLGDMTSITPPQAVSFNVTIN